MKGDNYSDSKPVKEAKTKLNNQKTILAKKYARLTRKELYTKRLVKTLILKLLMWFIQIIMRCAINGVFSVK